MMSRQTGDQGAATVCPRRQIRNARRQVCILTHGERDFGFAKSEAKFVLSNMEGTDPNDLTDNFYSSDPAIKRKREMLHAWTDEKI
jgi:hypothetical protein